MSELIISRPPTSGGRPRVPADPGRHRHPKARLRTHNGADSLVLELPFAPRGADLGGWADPWDTLDRPGRTPLVQRHGNGSPTLSHTYTLGHRDHQDSIEGLLSTLRRIARSGDRVTLVNLSPKERGPWRVADVLVNATARQHGTNHITRATVTVTYLDAADANPKLGPVHGGKKKHKGLKKPRHYTIRKGDTLRKLADRFYGEPGEWKRIARRNQIKNPARLKVGRVIVIPADNDPRVGFGKA